MRYCNIAISQKKRKAMQQSTGFSLCMLSDQPLNTKEKIMDIVFIQQLAVSTTIGVYEWEKKIKQKLLFDLEIASDVEVAAATDDINDAIDYAVVSDTITRYVEQNQFELIETVAEAVANIVLTDFAASWVSLTIQKPGAVENALTVGVKITRQKTA